MKRFVILSLIVWSSSVIFFFFAGLEDADAEDEVPEAEAEDEDEDEEAVSESLGGTFSADWASPSGVALVLAPKKSFSLPAEHDQRNCTPRIPDKTNQSTIHP